MKKRIFTTVAISALVLGTLPALADSGHDESASHQHEVMGHSHDVGEHEAKAPDNASPSEVMAKIHDFHTKLAATVSTKKLDDVHHLAFAIRDLASTLPSKAQPEKKAKVEGTVKSIAALAEALDESGDAKDQAKTEANLKKLDGLIKMLESQVSNA